MCVRRGWIGAQDKQIAWTAKQFSGDFYVPRSESFPMNQEKNYIYYASDKDPFLKLSEENYKFIISAVAGT